MRWTSQTVEAIRARILIYLKYASWSAMVQQTRASHEFDVGWLMIVCVRARSTHLRHSNCASLYLHPARCLCPSTPQSENTCYVRLKILLYYPQRTPVAVASAAAHSIGCGILHTLIFCVAFSPSKIARAVCGITRLFMNNTQRDAESECNFTIRLWTTCMQSLWFIIAGFQNVYTYLPL